MSVEIKSLTSGAPTMDNSLASPNDNFNIIPTANAVFNLYTASNDPANSKNAILKNIRLVNISSGSVKVNLYFMRPNSSNQYRRRQITPLDMVLQPGFLYIDDDELTLEPGDSIQAKADTANAIQYIISGLEQDVV